MMNDRKLGKTMASDGGVESLPNDASNPSAITRSSQCRWRAILTRARSNPRNSSRISASLDLERSAHPLRRQSTHLTKHHVTKMRSAAEFAHDIKHPLNLSIDINWTRTWVGNDPDGQILGRLMELTRKWLKPRYCKIFAQIAVRENPNGCANTHILVHCPPSILRDFKRQVLNVLDEACHGLNDRAVKFKRIGNGNSTLRATLGKLDYICKGTDPEVAKALGIRPTPQGQIYGKLYSISQDIQQQARRRYAEASRQLGTP
jgi:hypothetical protein